MVDILIAFVVGLLAALGGMFIKDAKALAVFTALIATAALLLTVMTNMITISLGVLGLVTAVAKISTAGKRIIERRIKTYKSRKRLGKLEELVKTLPENIVDVIPAGSVRCIHPRIVSLVTFVNNAYARGYAVEEPGWFRIVRQYLATVGPQFSADRTKVLSEYEIVELK
jgi:hypothetical protein